MDVNIALSWTHGDRRLTRALLEDLLPALQLYTDLRVHWWEDSHVLCGEELTESIVARFDEADFVLALLSARYFSRPFVRAHELPRFAGAGAPIGALPVALRRLPAHTEPVDLAGLERRLVFTHEGRSYEEVTGHRRTHFANGLASAIRRRVLGDDGYRAL